MIARSPSQMTIQVTANAMKSVKMGEILKRLPSPCTRLGRRQARLLKRKRGRV